MHVAAAAQAVMLMDADKKDGQRVLLAVGLSAAKDNSSTVNEVLQLHSLYTRHQQQHQILV